MIGFAGLSHLGIVSSIAAASKGHSVIAYDSDKVLCESLNDGQLPFLEPDLPELFKANRSNIRFTHDAKELDECQFVLFSQDVPTNKDASSNLAPLHDLIEQVIVHLSSDTTLIVLSQIPPGFIRDLSGTLNGFSKSQNFPLFYQVETLVFGRAVDRALHPERIIVGCDEPTAKLPEPYSEFLNGFDCPIIKMRYESAELTKLSINLFLVSSISLANTLAELCEVIGADWSEIAPALKLDKRIGPHSYLAPGLGISGGNLERDLSTIRALATELGTDAGCIEAWIANSSHRREWALKTIHSQVIRQNSDPTIAVWGLAYKQDTSSTKNSPALELIDSLSSFSIRAYDPAVVLDPGCWQHIIQGSSALDVCHGADVLVITTPWPAFSSIDLTQVREMMDGDVIIDPFGILNRDQCIELGFSYFKLGQPPKVMERAYDTA